MIQVDERVVVIADGTSFDPETVSSDDPLLDTTEKRHVDELLEALKPVAGRGVVTYVSPDAFMERIDSHRQDLVLPNWGGRRSRNRFAVIPSICEAAGIRYVGGDAYTKIVCQDKHLAKVLVTEAGLSTPKSQLVTSKAGAARLFLKPPLVVKPNFEGGSIGITQENLVHDIRDAERLTVDLLERFQAPILVEEFAVGREVSVCLLGHEGRTPWVEAGERYVIGAPDFLTNRLFSVELKKKRTLRTALRLMTAEVPPDVLQKCSALFALLGKVEIMRIDGRLTADHFSVIELTPDTHLGSRAEYAGTLMAAGFSYPEILSTMLTNTLDAYRYRGASR